MAECLQKMIRWLLSAKKPSQVCSKCQRGQNNTDVPDYRSVNQVRLRLLPHKTLHQISAEKYLNLDTTKSENFTGHVTFFFNLALKTQRHNQKAPNLS